MHIIIIQHILLLLFIFIFLNYRDKKTSVLYYRGFVSFIRIMHTLPLRNVPHHFTHHTHNCSHCFLFYYIANLELNSIFTNILVYFSKFCYLKIIK